MATARTGIPFAAVVLVLSTACTPNPEAASITRTPGDSSPAPATTPVAAGTAPAASTPTAPSADGPPLRPESAEGLTIPAAESFTRYYVETLSYLKATGDTSATQPAGDPGCRPCTTMLTTYRRTNAATEGIVGDYAWRDLTVTSAKLLDAATAEVEATTRQGAYTIRATPTDPLHHVPPTQYTLTLTLAAKGNHWVTFDISLEATK